jgi:hypothetical protein
MIFLSTARVLWTIITLKSCLDGVPMVACRVCQNMIDISGKKDQVKRV